jgi:DNA-binding transcriptional regulator YbjK
MARARAKQARQAPDPRRRREQVTDAALVVLGTEGSRGLTHRAVDEAAGLPAGSTSNLFRTRDALLEAAARRHAELDLPAAADVETATAAVAGGLDRDQARAMILAALDRVLADDARPALAARYELMLEATRRPSLRPVMNEARAHFVGLAATLLRATGCKAPEAHAPQLIALMDGVTADRLQGATSLDRDAIEALLDRFLTTC